MAFTNREIIETKNFFVGGKQVENQGDNGNMITI